MEQYIIVYSKYIITLFMILYTVLSFFRVFCMETGRKNMTTCRVPSYLSFSLPHF